VDVFFASSPASRSRLGLIVPKHGRKIVERNRVKRRLREIGRREVLPARDAEGMAVDVMIRARRKAYDASYEQLAREVRGAVEALCSHGS
jgi:ribonuclease P protein component